MLLCFALSFTNCEKDDDLTKSTDSNETNNSLKITFTPLDHLKTTNAKFLKTVKSHQKNSFAYGLETALSGGFYINDSKVQIIEKETYTTYTFFVYRDGITPNSIENYMYKLYTNGDYEQYLLKYYYELDGNGDKIYDINKHEIQRIEDANISFRAGSCVPEFVQVGSELVCNYNTTCTGGGGHSYSLLSQCACTDNPTCDPPGSTTCGFEPIYQFKPCGGVISDDNDTDVGNTDNDPSDSQTGGTMPSDNNIPNDNTTDAVVLENPDPIWQDAYNCINGLQIPGQTDQTTVSASTFEQTNFGLGEWQQVNNYLQANNCSEEAQEFVINVLNIIKDGDEVDYEDRIIKDSSFVDTKADCVYKLLKSTNNNLFKNVLETFTEGKAKYKLMFKIGVVTSGNEAETSGPENGIITITISPSAGSKSSLEIASTIIHESIHAELKRIYLNGNTGPNPFTTVRYNHLLDLYQFYETHGADITVASNASHMFMVQLYLDPLAVAIQALDDSFYSSLDYYKKYAWEGLEAVALATNPPLITQSQLDIYEQLNVITENDSKTQECD